MEQKESIREDSKYIFMTQIAGYLGGFIQKFAVHPIDTMKTKVQIQTTKLSEISQYQLSKKIILETFQKEGMRGFFKGVGISAFGGAPAFSLYVTSFEFFSKQFRIYSPLKKEVNDFISGFCAEIVACILFLPIDVIKERLQAQSNLNLYSYKNSIDAARQIVQNEGITTLYKAYPATIVYFGTFSGFYFTFYEYFKKMNSAVQEKPTFLETCFNSSLAGILASFISSPIEVAKVRIQVQRARGLQQMNPNNLQQLGNYNYKNVFDGTFQILKNEGYRNLYMGFPLKALQIVPATALSMSVTESIRSLLLEKF